MWLASIGAYKNIAFHNKRREIITPSDLSKLTGETDNDEVLKHVMYAFFLQDSFNIRDLHFSPFEYDRMGNQQKKWFFSLIWRDNEFLQGNIDYFRELLSEKHLFHGINPEVRIGLARGLATSKFTKELSYSIIEWYSHEDKPSVLYYLLKHFQQFQSLSEGYKEIVEYQSEYGQEPFKELISVHEKLYVQSEEKHSLNISFRGSKEMEVKLGNATQVNIFEGNNNQVIYNESGMTKWETMENELKEIMQKCKDDEKQRLQDAIDALGKRDESGFKAALKRVVEVGSNIFSNVTANVLVAYMRANGIIP